MKFINTPTIKKAYTELTNIEVKNASLFHIFLILKGCGINDTTALPVEVITEKGYPIASDLSLLFSYFEQKPPKYDFINPFSMKEWSAQAPSETLKKWVSSRIKNNIIGGATTWRKIIREDIYNNKIKLAHNYIDEIKNLTIPNNKIKLWPLVVWYNRFNKFDRSYSPNELIQGFIKELNITEQELGKLFDKSVAFYIEFSDVECDMSAIRNLIGSPPNTTGSTWNESTIITTVEPQAYYEYKNKIMTNQKNASEEKIIKLLKDNFQIILSGPPGTSKSYIADIISKKLIVGNSNLDSILKIQFHPQYSYQDFIGGFIVNGDKVEMNRGVFLRFLDKVKSSEKDTFVLIIDEINRANVGSVFGELIQCLDRNYSLNTMIAGKEETLYIPENLFIIATMNTADRTLGSLDFALRRRFVDIYIAPDENILTDTTKTESGISLADLLKKINTQLKSTLRNNELVIGQTIFFNEAMKSDDVYYWNNENLEDLFNYKILSMIEDYCNKEANKVNEVISDKLQNRLTSADFISALSEYIS
jgi:5-methylcytosine-specific restriction protein B